VCGGADVRFVQVPVFIVALVVAAWVEYQALQIAASQVGTSLGGRMVVFGAGVGVAVMLTGIATTLSGGYAFDGVIASVVLIVFAVVFSLTRPSRDVHDSETPREDHITEG